MSPWRARFGRRDAPPPSVSAVVRQVRFSLKAAHAAEALLFFVAGSLAVRSATLVSRVSEADLREAWMLAGCTGLLCAAAWWLEHPVRLHATARALDERLRHHGALLTAFEIEQRRPAQAATSMEELLRRRVMTRLRRDEAVRALFPPLFLPLAAPTLAGLALVLLVDAQRAPGPAALDLLSLAEGLERALSAGEARQESAKPASAGEDEDEPAREASRLLSSLLRTQRGLPTTEEGWREAPLEWLDRLAELDARVAEAAERRPAGAVAERLEEARAWLDALRTGLRAQTPPKDEGTGQADGTAPGPQGTISPSAPARPTPMPPDPSLPPSSIASASALATDGEALGRQAGNWWPKEYDPVVERFVELSRAARAKSGGSGVGPR